MRVWAIESRFDVPGDRTWLLWSGTHFYKSQVEANAAMKKLDHKSHPLPCNFRVVEYGPKRARS